MAKITIESSNAIVPKSVALRSPVRTVMYPAIGALIANTRGRATDRKPDLGDAVAVDLLHEQREEEEAAEVGEAREAPWCPWGT